MKNALTLLVASISLIMTACSSSSQTSHRVNPSTPNHPITPSDPLDSSASINSIPKEYQDTVKTIKDIKINGGEDFNGTIKINGQFVGANANYKVSELPNGLTVATLEVDTVDESDQSKLNYQTDIYIYQQPYSVVYGNYLVSSTNPTDMPHLKKLEYSNVVGLRTEHIPAAGKATYKGDAFYNKQTGTLKYDIDFTSKTGSGEITGFDQFGKISLLSDQISADVKLKDDTFGAGIVGEVIFEKGLEHLNGNYQLGLFGPHAEEIAGGLWNINGDVNIIFGGQRDAIKTQP